MHVVNITTHSLLNTYMHILCKTITVYSVVEGQPSIAVYSVGTYSNDSLSVHYFLTLEDPLSILS